MSLLSSPLQHKKILCYGIHSYIFIYEPFMENFSVDDRLGSSLTWEFSRQSVTTSMTLPLPCKMTREYLPRGLGFRGKLSVAGLTTDRYQYCQNLWRLDMGVKQTLEPKCHGVYDLTSAMYVQPFVLCICITTQIPSQVVFSLMMTNSCIMYQHQID